MENNNYGLEYVDRYPYSTRQRTNFQSIYAPNVIVQNADISMLIQNHEKMNRRLKKVEKDNKKLKELIKIIKNKIGININDIQIGQDQESIEDDNVSRSRSRFGKQQNHKRQFIAKQYAQARKNGMSLERFCELNGLAQRTVQTWFKGK